MTALRDLERASIRAFVESCSEQLSGRVLDFGCGTQPYRDVVEAAGGTYVPFDRRRYPGNVSGEDVGGYGIADGWTAVLCTQMIQYAENTFALLAVFHQLLSARGGYLVLTGPTNWPEDEPEDLFRFTRTGIAALLRLTGFEVLRCESRAQIPGPDGVPLSLGFGVVARPSS